MGVPFIGFGNGDLEGRPEVKAGQSVICPHCSMPHVLEAGLDDKGNVVHTLYFISCGESSYLAAVAGKLVLNLPPSVSGEF